MNLDKRGKKRNVRKGSRETRKEIEKIKDRFDKDLLDKHVKRIK